jgi:glycosyltransferase involved in cell wall biosynthesis
VSFEGQVSRAQVFARLAEASAVVFPGLREEGGIALAEALLLGVPVIVLAHGGAETVAAGATDPSRVALIPPGRVDETARLMGEAMGRFRTAKWTSTGPLLDYEHWQRRLHQALEDALAGAGPTPALSGNSRLADDP